VIAAQEYVAIGRHRIRVAVQGNGRPLLLINGVGANLDMWNPLLPALNAETIVYDAPGTGRSPVPVVPLSIPKMAKIALRLLDVLGFEEVDVLGVSLGGVVAQQVALRAPERVRKLVLASTTWGVGMWPGSMKAWSVLLSPARYYVPGHYERHAPDFLGGRTGREPELARTYGNVRRAQPPHPVGHFYQLMGGATWTNLPLLHRIKAPTLVLSGDDDPLVRPNNARILAWRIPNSQLRIIPGGGHLVIFDSVDEVAPVLNDFLR
jgi:poly(3-hydroxyoctanoate) depolymerase